MVIMSRPPLFGSGEIGPAQGLVDQLASRPRHRRHQSQHGAHRETRGRAAHVVDRSELGHVDEARSFLLADDIGGAHHLAAFKSAQASPRRLAAPRPISRLSSPPGSVAVTPGAAEASMTLKSKERYCASVPPQTLPTASRVTASMPRS